MFDIVNDQLLFKNRAVARLQQVPLSVLRDFEETVLDFTTAADFEDDHAEAVKAAHDEGFEAGKEDGREDAKNELEDAKAKIEDAAWERGYEKGQLDSDHAADAIRVMELLNALQEIHNKLLPVYLGFEEPGKFKRRPAKVGEAKKLATECCAAARRAVLAFRGE